MSILEELNKLEIVVRFKVSSIVMNNIELDIFKKELINKDKVHRKIIKREFETEIKYNKHKKKDRRVKYSENDIDYIINSGQGNEYLAKRFNTNRNNIIKLKYRFKNQVEPDRKPRGYKYRKNNLTPTDIPAEKAPE